MNKQMTFNVTLLENRYGDYTRSVDMTWKEYTDRIKDPPVCREKEKSGIIIGGHCEWQDGVAIATLHKKRYARDENGEIIIKNGEKQLENYEYKKEIKDENGNPIPRPIKGTRKVIDRSLLFLDCDSIKDFDEWFDAVYELCGWWGWAFAMHTSFSAEPEKPRYRVIIPLSKPVSQVQYGRIAKAIMHDLKEENFDTCSWLATQVMYLPVWPQRLDPETEEWENGYYEYYIEDGDGKEPLDVDEFLSYLDTFSDDYANFKEIPRTKTGEPVEDVVKRKYTYEKKEDLTIYPEGDPRNKNNIIGEFCRAYTISEAIEEFDLPYDCIRENVYKYRGSHHPPGGFIKEDDTLFLSYHTTDPANLTEEEKAKTKPDGEPYKGPLDRNAFDLVMIHKFDGDYIKMCKFAKEILSQ